nr:outer envelope pore protein 37, chloroplastic [Ipomoea batatas]
MPEAELHSPAPAPPNPNSALFVLKAPAPAPPPTAVKSESPSPPPPNGGGRGGFGPLLWLQSLRPKIRVTTEYDSDSTSFQHRISCRLLDSLAKVKLSFQNNGKGEISEPQVDLTSKYLSLHYDVEDQNAIVKANFDVTPGLQLEAVHDVKSQQGQVVMVADLAGPAYKFELSSSVPAIGMPRASFKFPYGEISLEQKEEEEEDVKKVFSINGILKGHILNGICSARYKDEDLNLRYCFKDEQMAFIPSISLPSNAVSFAFKRRFGPSDKLSYWYNFDSNDWSAVYKHTAGKDYKFKAGYDSEVRLGWASLWVGDEDGAAKTAPMKMKVQFMLQVPQDDIKSSNLMFRVKKRWDL